MNKSDWIIVKDRLPEPFINVLTTDGNNVEILFYTKYLNRITGEMVVGWTLTNNSESTDLIWENITHWMPLPEPPND